MALRSVLEDEAAATGRERLGDFEVISRRLYINYVYIYIMLLLYVCMFILYVCKYILYVSYIIHIHTYV
jgi:uncharacterized membrane protein